MKRKKWKEFKTEVEKKILKTEVENFGFLLISFLSLQSKAKENCLWLRNADPYKIMYSVCEYVETCCFHLSSGSHSTFSDVTPPNHRVSGYVYII